MPNRLMELESAIRGPALRRKLTAEAPATPAAETGRPVIYTVPGTIYPLAQASETQGWGVTFAMLTAWKNGQAIDTETALSQIGSKWLEVYRSGTGISGATKVEFIAASGLIAEPARNYSVDEWHNLIRSNGPLWVTGAGPPDKPWATQSRVVTGISGDGTAEGTFFSIIDPNGGRAFREKIAAFIANLSGETGHARNTRLQVIHWPSDARTGGRQSMQGNVVPLNAKAPKVVVPGPAISVMPATHLNVLIGDLVAQGINEIELRAFLAEIGAQTGGTASPSKQASVADAMGQVTVTLPGGVILEGWRAQAFRAALSAAIRTAPAGTFLGPVIDALPAVANRFSVTIGLGPAVAGGLGAGAGFGVGIVFAPGHRIGFYGSASGILGVIASISATAQVTVIRGGPENFRGSALLVGVSVDVGGGPTVGAHAILSTNGHFLGVTGAVGLTLGLSPIEAFAQYQYTASTLGLAQSAAGVRDFDIKLRVFIPSPAVDGPGINPMGGDGRGFHYSAGTHRAVIHARVGAGTSASHSPTVTVLSRGWGQSHEYRQSDVTAVAGRPSWFKNLIGTPTPIRSAALPTTASNLSISARSVSLGGTPAVKVTLHAAGALPLIRMSPDIDVDIDVFFANTGSWHYMIRGSHDGFPAYELYVDQRLVYAHDPVGSGQTPLSLLPPSEFSVSTPWRTI